MKKTILKTSLMLGIASAINCTSVLTVASQAQAEDYCAILGAVARSSMEARQHDMPMHEMIDHARKAATGHTYELIKFIIQKAYEQPEMLSEEGKHRAAIQYENQAEAACYSLGDK